MLEQKLCSSIAMNNIYILYRREWPTCSHTPRGFLPASAGTGSKGLPGRHTGQSACCCQTDPAHEDAAGLTESLGERQREKERQIRGRTVSGFMVIIIQGIFISEKAGMCVLHLFSFHLCSLFLSWTLFQILTSFF